HIVFSSRSRHTIAKRDWSSDVCSSDLHNCGICRTGDGRQAVRQAHEAAVAQKGEGHDLLGVAAEPQILLSFDLDPKALKARGERSEERRVGKGWRARMGQYVQKKN